MKPFIIVCLALITFSTVALTYRSTGDELVWETDFATSIEKAKKENKKLFVNFTGSDWCGWCIRLEKEVFSKEEFVAYANKNFVCVKLDFPRTKKLPEAEAKQNYDLAKQYSVKGFPTIMMLDTDKAVILQTGYQFGGVQPYIDHLEVALAKIAPAKKK